MPQQITQYKCLLISPSDVTEERDAITEVIHHWNAQIGQALNAKVELIRWESHAVPDLGGAPQDVINKQVVDECDFGIAVFWARLGTPTAEFESGSLEEVHRLSSRGARVLVYFNTSPISQDALKDDQFQRLSEAKKGLETLGLLGSYSSVENLREQVLLHVTSVVSSLIPKDRPDIGSIRGFQGEELAKPDVRVRAASAVVIGGLRQPQKILTISVQNHSTSIVFLGGVYIATKNGRSLYLVVDGITGEHQHRRRLIPGEAFEIRATLDMLRVEANPQDLICAFVRDDIEREYRSNEDEFKREIKKAFEPIE